MSDVAKFVFNMNNDQKNRTYYEIKLGYSMEGTFKCISGTGRYEGIECSGTTGYTQMKTAQEGKVHSTNFLKGTYTLKK